MVERFPAGVPIEELYRSNRDGADAALRFDGLAHEYGRIREIYDALVRVVGSDPTWGRAGRVFSEVRDPLAAERSVTPADRQFRDPRVGPSILWPDESDPTTYAASTRRRLEAFARCGVPPWCPSTAELSAAREAGVEKPKRLKRRHGSGCRDRTEVERPGGVGDGPVGSVRSSSGP